MQMMPRCLAALTVVALPALVLAGAQKAPPTAPVRPVVDTYFEIPVADPYRWMEGTENAERAEWMAEQNVHTRSVLEGLPLRHALLERIDGLSSASDEIGAVLKAGGKYFVVKIAAGQNEPRGLRTRGPGGHRARAARSAGNVQRRAALCDHVPFTVA
jgi:protease II